MVKIKNNKSEIQSIFMEACARKEFLIFVTTYLRFESSFVHLDGDEIHAKATMGRGDALTALRVAGLKLRFPHGFSFLEAPAKLIGKGLHEGVNTIKVALPTMLYENDDRKAFRVGHVGNVAATVSTPGNHIIDASLLDISATGAKLSSREALSSNMLKANDRIMLTIPIPGVATINNGAIVRYMESRIFGVEYLPKLPASVMDPLARWIFKKQEEEREHLTRRRELSDKAAAAADAIIDMSRVTDEGGILVITRDDEMEAALEKLLSEGRSVFRAQPNAASLKNMLEKNPHLVIVHIAANNIEVRRLLKSLISTIPAELPILLLGTGIESEALFELGQQWKAASSIAYTKERCILIQRLVLGMLRKHYGHGESPMTPNEF